MSTARMAPHTALLSAQFVVCKRHIICMRPSTMQNVAALQPVAGSSHVDLSHMSEQHKHAGKSKVQGARAFAQDAMRCLPSKRNRARMPLVAHAANFSWRCTSLMLAPSTHCTYNLCAHHPSLHSAHASPHSAHASLHSAHASLHFQNVRLGACLADG